MFYSPTINMPANAFGSADLILEVLAAVVTLITVVMVARKAIHSHNSPLQF